MEEKLFDSFEMRDEHGKLTNAGALLADDAPIKHSRLFCTRWNGLDKSGGMVDALDSAEYSGSLIILLNEGVGFVKRNMKTRWKKTANSRIEMPDYCERSVFEALVNALIHRDYLILEMCIRDSSAKARIWGLSSIHPVQGNSEHSQQPFSPFSLQQL